MQRQFKWLSVMGVAVVMALLLGGAVAQAEPGDTDEGSGSGWRMPLIDTPLIDTEAKPAADWWLGLQCRPIDEALRTHLGIAEAEGLVVEKTVPNSPAEKAGLKRHDVLVSVDGKPLKSPLELIDAVNAAEGKSLTLKYLRGGQTHEVAVTPEHRPEWAQTGGPGPRTAQEAEMVRRWLEQLQPGSPNAPMRFRFLQPGTILPPDAPAHPPLPANVTITITKHGGDLARVTVTRDSEKWDVAENELDKLPKDLVPYAEFMLGRSWPGAKESVRLFEFAPDWSGRTPPPAAEAPEPSQRQALDERLDRIDRQLEQLQRSLDALRQERGR